MESLPEVKDTAMDMATAMDLTTGITIDTTTVSSMALSSRATATREYADPDNPRARPPDRIGPIRVRFLRLRWES